MSPSAKGGDLQTPSKVTATREDDKVFVAACVSAIKATVEATKEDDKVFVAACMAAITKWDAGGDVLEVEEPPVDFSTLPSVVTWVRQCGVGKLKLRKPPKPFVVEMGEEGELILPACNGFLRKILFQEIEEAFPAFTGGEIEEAFPTFTTESRPAESTFWKKIAIMKLTEEEKTAREEKK
ncbi:hypothetical protein T484DRAFT_1833465, partial [Baffinella frigidus]